MKRALFVITVFFAASAAAEAPLTKRSLVSIRQGPLPSTVAHFTARLEKEKSKAKLYERVRSLMTSPVIVRETSYQFVGTSCVRSFREFRGSSAAKLNPFLKRLAEAFHKAPVRELASGLYGVAPEENCSHIMTVKLDAKGSRIETITVDGQTP